MTPDAIPAGGEEPFFLLPQFWTAAAFVLFVLLIYRPIARYAARALDARSARIAQELEEAKRLRQEAQALLAVYRDKQRESLKEAEAMIAETREDALRLGERAEEELKAALEKRAKLATETIARAEAQALKDVQNHVVDIAIAAARALVQEHLAGSQGDELVRQAASELERKLH